MSNNAVSLDCIASRSSTAFSLFSAYIRYTTDTILDTRSDEIQLREIRLTLTCLCLISLLCLGSWLCRRQSKIAGERERRGRARPTHTTPLHTDKNTEDLFNDRVAPSLVIRLCYDCTIHQSAFHDHDYDITSYDHDSTGWNAKLQRIRRRSR